MQLKRNTQARTRGSRLLLLFISLWCLSAAAVQAAITFRATAESSTVEAGEPFAIQFELNTTDVSDFQLPTLRGFSIVSNVKTFTSHRQSIINGKRSSSESITYTVIVRATAAGEYTIPAASVRAGGKTVRSNPLKIKVVESSGSSRNSGRSSSSSRGIRRTNPQNAASIGDDDLFVLCTASKTQVHEQEALLLTYKVYTNVTFRGFNNAKLPDFEGFHSQEIPLPQNATLVPETYNGREYLAAPYRQFLLFPQKSGDLEIPAAVFDAAVEVGGALSFEDLLNGAGPRMVQKQLKTRSYTIHVAPLPSPRPADFSGGVGQFDIEATMKSDQGKTNEAMTLQVRVSGTGNLKLVTAPEIDFPKDFDVYDPEIKENIKPTADGMQGEKTFEYTIIPRNVGTYEIPSIGFSYFDGKEYRQLHTQPIRLSIARGKGTSGSGVSDYGRRGEERQTDIRPMHPVEAGSLAGAAVLSPGWKFLLVFFLLPAALFAIICSAFRKKAYYSRNVLLMREKGAGREARKRLRKAERLLAQQQEEAFYEEIIRAEWGYVSDKLRIPTALLSKDHLRQALPGQGVTAETVALLLESLEDCEFARYAPGDKRDRMKQSYEKALRVITLLDTELKNKNKK